MVLYSNHPYSIPDRTDSLLVLVEGHKKHVEITLLTDIPVLLNLRIHSNRKNNNPLKCLNQLPTIANIRILDLIKRVAIHQFPNSFIYENYRYKR